MLEVVCFFSKDGELQCVRCLRHARALEQKEQASARRKRAGVATAASLAATSLGLLIAHLPGPAAGCAAVALIGAGCAIAEAISPGALRL
jgi:hypothetical protein